MIKAVLFDLGGVYFEDGTDKFLKKLSSKIGKSYNDLYPIFRMGKSLEYRRNEISGKEFFGWAAKELDTDFTADQLNEMWVSEYTEVTGVKEIIKDLKKKGIKVTILSDNVPERIEYLQKKYKFLNVFDDVVLSYEVNLVKTSEEMFNLALSRVNCKPEETIFVDDREINLDVAKQLGIIPILYTTPENLERELRELL